MQETAGTDDPDESGIAPKLTALSGADRETPDKSRDEAWLRREIARLIDDFGEPGQGRGAPDGLVREVQGCLAWLVRVGAGREWLERSLKRMDTYGATVRAAFGERHLPELLDYVALIESGYHARARSHAGAAGLWQFMPATGKRYGLQIGREVDERLDPIKATLAAREYLLDLLLEFGGGHDALLAIAAYNAGEGRIRGVLHQLGDYRARSFWSLAERGLLPAETKTYVPMILAAGIAARNRPRFGLVAAEPKAALAFDLESRPRAKKDPQQRLEPSAKRASTPRPSGLRYLVRRGNTAGTIAGALLVTPRVIEKAAGGPKGLRVGRVIEVPISGWERISHRVMRGDTLERIARRYGTRVQALMVFNGLATSRIVAGDLLAIYRAEQVRKPGSVPAANPVTDRMSVANRRAAPALATRRGDRKPSKVAMRREY